MLAALRLLIGPEGLGWPADAIIWELRTVRAAAAAVVGAALARAGVLLQTLLRNPLASPDLLGLSTGAGLGVSLAMLIGYQATGRLEPPAGAGLAAFVGAAGALAVTYVVSRRRGGLDPATLILVGVIVSIICGAGIQFVHHLLPDRGVSAARWLVGAIDDNLGTGRLAFSAALCLAAMLIASRWSPWLDAASLSDDEAASVGVPLAPLRAMLLLTSGVLATLAVLIAGPLGFVGLVAPHAARLLGGPGHRLLVWSAPLAGAALVLAADIGVRLIATPTGRVPLGVITAVVGGPVFIVLLLRERRGAV